MTLYGNDPSILDPFAQDTDEGPEQGQPLVSQDPDWRPPDVEEGES